MSLMPLCDNDFTLICLDVFLASFTKATMPNTVVFATHQVKRKMLAISLKNANNAHPTNDTAPYIIIPTFQLLPL
jgi:hypothetical protein